MQSFMIKYSARTNMSAEKIPMPTDKYLFLDLDMTLIDRFYQITDQGIFGEIERLQHHGWQIGLNSNTPFEPLMVWMQYFKMDGPLVAEKGAVVFDNGQLVFNEVVARRINVARKAIEGDLKARRIQWVPGNPVDIIRENRFREFQPGPLVLLNTARRCSINFYVREITSDGQVKINPELTSEIVENLEIFYRGTDYLEEEISLENGILLAMPKGQTKRSGTIAFMESRGLKQVGIIGDSMNDYLGDDIAVHYAVGNAKEDYKRKAVFISEHPMTKGCTDILVRMPA